MIRPATLFLLITLPIWAGAQNLIPNGDFEDRSPEGSEVWVQPEGPNYHWDSTGQYGEPYEGNYYNGICISNFEFSEALSVTLKEPLKAEQEYHISFYVRQFRGTQGTYNHDLATEMQVYFTHSRPPPKPRRLYRTDRNRLAHITLPPFGERSDYQLVQTTYTAQGGERYFNLGYFATDDPAVQVIPACESVTAKPLNVPCPGDPGYQTYQAKKKKETKPDVSDPIHQSYANGIPAFRTRFYLDNLCFAPIAPDGTWSCEQPGKEPEAPAKPETGEVYVIDRIYFEFDSTRLLPESFPALDSLVHVLQLYPDLNIRIQGHTDSLGSDSYNQALSEGRAQSVYTYLIGQGIDSNRLSFTGYGESQPVAPNTTPENRQRNRRVEFKVLEDQ